MIFDHYLAGYVRETIQHMGMLIMEQQEIVYALSNRDNFDDLERALMVIYCRYFVCATGM